MRLNTFGHEDAASAAGKVLRESVAHVVRNRLISEFLSSNNKCYIIGPKGTGKTLLLLKKALELAESDGSVLLIPRDADLPVDRMTAQSQLGKQFFHKMKNPSEQALAWTTGWMNAIYKAVIYNLCDVAGNLDFLAPSRSLAASRRGGEAEDLYARQVRSAAADLVGPPPYGRRKAVFDFYAEVVGRLDDMGLKGVNVIRKENERCLEVLARVDRPVYVFMDNLDAYYELFPELWLASIYGQFRAVRDIRLTLRNIHLFTSIRKDVYTRFRTEEIIQYNDYITFLDYSRTELLQVFEQALARLQDDLLALPAKRESDPWSAFFGDASTLTNVLVGGKEESIRDYICRHSLWRPRDLITIGNHILNAKSDQPLDEGIVHHGVANASSELCRQYLEEIRPMVPLGLDVEAFVSECLPSNVCSYDELQEACLNFHVKYDPVAELEECHRSAIVCALYSSGLLGHVTRSVSTGELEQRFLKPGEAHALEDMRRAPRSDWYVLHPILDGMLGHERVNRKVVVGYNLAFPSEP